jgi:hypothetical protein
MITLLLAGMAQASETESAASPSLVLKSGQPLDLLLTRAELQAVIRDYENRTGENHTAPIVDDEVIVTAPGVRLPMRDPARDIPGAIAAPFWAIMNPTQSWRIFLPVPPEPDDS